MVKAPAESRSLSGGGKRVVCGRERPVPGPPAAGGPARAARGGARPEPAVGAGVLAGGLLAGLSAGPSVCRPQVAELALPRAL